MIIPMQPGHPWETWTSGNQTTRRVLGKCHQRTQQLPKPTVPFTSKRQISFAVFASFVLLGLPSCFPFFVFLPWVLPLVVSGCFSFFFFVVASPSVLFAFGSLTRRFFLLFYFYPVESVRWIASPYQNGHATHCI